LAERARPNLSYAPPLARAHEPAGEADELHISTRIADIVDAAVLAEQVGGADVAAFIGERAARDVEDRAGLRYNLKRLQRDGATDTPPLADRVLAVGNIAADLQQSARRIVTIGLIAAGTGRHENEIARVDPDVGILQVVAVPVE